MAVACREIPTRFAKMQAFWREIAARGSARALRARLRAERCFSDAPVAGKTNFIAACGRQNSAGNGSRTQETVCSLHDELPFGNLKKRVSRFFFCAAEENGDIVV